MQFTNLPEETVDCVLQQLPLDDLLTSRAVRPPASFSPPRSSCTHRSSARSSGSSTPRGSCSIASRLVRTASSTTPRARSPLCAGSMSYAPRRARGMLWTLRDWATDGGRRGGGRGRGELPTTGMTGEKGRGGVRRRMRSARRSRCTTSPPSTTSRTAVSSKT